MWASHASGAHLGPREPTHTSRLRTVPMSSPHILETDDDHFEQALRDPQMTTVAFFCATWSGPCALSTPLIEAKAQMLADKVRVVRLNVDNNPRTPAIYGVSTLPTLLLFSGGRVTERISGAFTQPELVGFFLKAAESEQ